MAALCKPHSASWQKFSVPVHSTLLDEFASLTLILDVYGLPSIEQSFLDEQFDSTQSVLRNKYLLYKQPFLSYILFKIKIKMSMTYKTQTFLDFKKNSTNK